MNPQIPQYHETFNPILNTLQSGVSMKSRELELKVEEGFYSHLPKALLDERVSSGAKRISDRISWGKSYLKMGKFLHYPKRGYVQITDKGRAALASGGVSLQDLQQDPDFIEHRDNAPSRKDQNTNTGQISLLEDWDPQEMIDRGMKELRDNLKSDLLDKLQGMDPYDFERLILVLLKRMGYGEFTETARSGDGGIDGIINEDKLGLEKIYTQAKRYNTSNKVRESDIRNFIGAMSGDTRKGVFITTSAFDDAAIRKAREAHHTIILVDGGRLTDLMIDYNVGVQVKDTHHIKQIDLDIFEN